MESPQLLKLVQSNPGNKYQYYEETDNTSQEEAVIIPFSKLIEIPRWLIRNPTSACVKAVCALIPKALLTKNGLDMNQMLLISPEIVALLDKQQQFRESVVMTCNLYKKNKVNGTFFFLFKHSEDERFFHYSFDCKNEKNKQ